MVDQVKFSPFTYLGLYGDAVVSKTGSVRLEGMRPSKITGHFIEEERCGWRGIARVREREETMRRKNRMIAVRWPDLGTTS